MTQERDSIDFGREDIPRLFRRILLPTIFGMLFTVVFIITDGIFVGRGLGSEALAAVNIVAPLFMSTIGIGLMFGMGGSVVASIHLSNGKLKVARLNATQAFTATVTVMSVMILIATTFPEQTLRLMGSSDKLLPLASEYFTLYAPFLIANALMATLGFFVRLNGAVRYAMICSIIAAVINIVLDYLFIFPLGLGLWGAALATGIGTTVGAVMMLVHLFNRRHTIHLMRIKLSRRSLQLSLRNIGYMCKLGSSSLFGELAIALMVICGNNVFVRELGEDGVAAFSIACYLFPIIFILNNAISQSVQPIISFNYGTGDMTRVDGAFRLALKTGLGYGAVIVVCMFLFSGNLVSMFIPSSAPAYAIAEVGLPLFSLGFLPFAANMILIGYFQSVEQIGNATLVTLMRGFVFLIASFCTVPHLFGGGTGAWLSVPVSESLTIMVVLFVFLLRRGD